MSLAIARYEMGDKAPPRLVNPALAAAFGRRVALRRAELEMTQAAMIKQLNHFSGGDWGRSSASVWENGHAEPSISTIFALAKVLCTRPEYLAFGVRQVEIGELRPPARGSGAISRAPKGSSKSTGSARRVYRYYPRRTG